MRDVVSSIRGSDAGHLGLAGEDGETVSSSQDSALLLEMYRRMLLSRKFDLAAIDCHRKGEIPGPVHMSIGQEGEIVGACLALNDSDYMAGNHRSHGHPIGKNADVSALMAELFGRSSGTCKGRGGSMHLADFSVGSLGESGIVGSALPVAVGAALSSKIRATNQVALAFFGDGGVNTGAFHESLNLAAVWSLPVIFLCENNGYAVTTPSSDVTAGNNIAGRATSYDIPGYVVDGQDCIKVFRVVSEAVFRAREGAGPTLVEARTYRYRDHAEFGSLRTAVTAYRTTEELDEWQQRDPLRIHRERLVSCGLEEGAKQLEAQTDEVITSAVAFARSSAFPDPATIWEYVYTSV